MKVNEKISVSPIPTPTSNVHSFIVDGKVDVVHGECVELGLRPEGEVRRFARVEGQSDGAEREGAASSDILEGDAIILRARSGLAGDFARIGSWRRRRDELGY